jgi:vitamin K-dependent gamma-carboxylase
VGVPYFFAGIAKLNFDWLFRAEPLREWLLDDSDFPLIGGLFAYEPVVYAMAIGSTLLDLASPFLLLHRRTRTAVYGLTLAFHFMNSRLFGIGIFPWMMIVATTLFFDADWPRRFIASLRSGRLVTRLAIAGGFAIGFAVGGLLPDTFSYFRASVGGFGVAVFVFHALPGPLRQATHARPLRRPTPWQRFRLGPALAWFLAIWVAVQLLLPLRHWLYPGNHNWTDEGHRFAWNLLVRQKRIVATFIVTDPATDETWTVSPSGFLNPFQVGRVTTYPDIALQFAHHVERYYREQRGLGDLEVRVRTFGWLNTREPQELIRPNVDLTKVDRPYISPADWIAPLEPY